MSNDTTASPSTAGPATPGQPPLDFRWSCGSPREDLDLPSKTSGPNGEPLCLDIRVGASATSGLIPIGPKRSLCLAFDDGVASQSPTWCYNRVAGAYDHGSYYLTPSCTSTDCDDEHEQAWRLSEGSTDINQATFYLFQQSLVPPPTEDDGESWRLSIPGVNEDDGKVVVQVAPCKDPSDCWAAVIDPPEGMSAESYYTTSDDDYFSSSGNDNDTTTEPKTPHERFTTIALYSLIPFLLLLFLYVYLSAKKDSSEETPRRNGGRLEAATTNTYTTSPTRNSAQTPAGIPTVRPESIRPIPVAQAQAIQEETPSVRVAPTIEVNALPVAGARSY